MADDREREMQIRLIFTPLPREQPWQIRLRHVLKIALRAFGLRCVRIEQLPAKEQPCER